MAIRTLTSTAIAEFDAIVKGARVPGPDAAERTLLRLIVLFDGIARGRGHRRTDLGFAPFVLSRHLRPLPFTIVYDGRTDIVLRIIGAKGLHERLLLTDLDPS